MSLSDHSDLATFRALVARRLGLHLGDDRLGLVEELLARRAKARGVVPAEYVRFVASARETPSLVSGIKDEAVDELRLVARELTVTETYFFRNAAQLRAFEEVVLAGHAKRPGRKFRILSAGCASGEEAYTLAMLVRGEGHGFVDASIDAIDLNVAMLEKAARGRYSDWALRETSAAMQARWFSREGANFVVDPAIREMVTFAEKNLLEEDLAFWRPNSFDVVFCRNVIMYFAPETARRIVARIATSLAPDGHLFLGHAETLRGLSHDFHLRHTHESFYYQRRTTGERRRPSSAASAPHAPHAPHAPDDAWRATAGESAAPPRSIVTEDDATGAAAEGIPASLEVVRAPTWDIGAAIELVGRERFAEARALLAALPPESANDPEALLLSAVLYTHGGDLVTAQEVCRQLLAIDEMSAGAHYVMALCREDAGDRRGAAEHDQLAMYLDPGFAMPRLHLGLLARRAGDHDTARQELGQALPLLRCEDASRLVLFGGGFQRDALIALCRAELLASGGAP